MASNAHSTLSTVCAALIPLTVMGCENGSLRAIGDNEPKPCPVAVTYSPEDQAALAAELERLGNDSQVVRWLADYENLVRQTNECNR